jgi:hypothetical protein
MERTHSDASRPNGPGFPLLAARLVGCILVEMVAGVFHMIVFLFRRRAERERIRSIILGAGRAAAAVLVLCLLALGPMGCESCHTERMTSHPGTSLEWHWNQLVDSADDIFRMRDWKESLTSDLEDLVSDDPCQLPETFALWGW